MEKIKEIISNERSQYLVFFSISLGVAILTGIMYFSDPSSFQRFIGRINPLIAVLLVILLGIILLSFLLSRGWFAIYRKKNLKGLLYAPGLAALFALVIILVDLIVIFPPDINVLFPGSLLFYPAIAFFAEILFHVLPLSLVLLFLTPFSKKIGFEKIIWISIFMVSFLEPVYQTVLGSSKPYPLWTEVYVGLHVFLINLSQLIFFKRFDFVTMYSFRLTYYLLWHIAWGYVRLKWLF